MIIDASNVILGRLGSYAAKKSLLGEKIDIVNCENSIVTGSRYEIFEHYHKLFNRGTQSKGPFFYRMPDKFVKRTIRGMLPYKKDRGKRALKNIRCHIGIPESFKNQKFETIKHATSDKIPNLRYISVKELCMYLGAKLK